MDDEQRRMIAVTARMEGNAAVVANIGKKILVSEMELICLTNFAEIGLLSIFASLDGEAGEAADADLDGALDAVRRGFARDTADDGLMRLSTSTAALLRGTKFSKYIAR
jgi:hypothetical protein